MSKRLVILLSFALSVCCYGADIRYCTKVHQPKQVKTLRIRYADRLEGRKDLHPERPYLVLKNGIVDGSEADNQLEISFDELSHSTKQYSYTVTHLNSDWTESGIISTDYLRGFTTSDIIDYEPSLNTSVDYTHYSFIFPNNDMQLTASGNYVIRIYEDGDMDKQVAWACFSVVEPAVKIQMAVTAQTDIEYNGRYQQLEITIQTPNVHLSGNSANIGDNYWIVVRQNGRTDNEVVRPTPSYIESNKLKYIHCKDLIFEGGNEYHRFDAFSTYIAGENINRIIYDAGEYHAPLYADRLQPRAPYMNEPDANGQFVVNAERTLNSIEYEAEYMWVHWTLPTDKPLFDGAIYIGGDIFYNQFDSQNRMLYDTDNKCYYLTSLVKQGGYDYQYWQLPKGSKKASLLNTEGSHWETRNEYSIYVYYRPFGERYDRLVGLYTSSSE